MMYDTSVSARAVNLRGRPGASGGRASGRAGADRGHDPLVVAQLDGAGHEIEGALFGVAFLEQHAAGVQLANLSLAGEGVQILRLQAVERREGRQNRDVHRSVKHLRMGPQQSLQVHDF